jgi:hypothetical protein
LNKKIIKVAIIDDGISHDSITERQSFECIVFEGDELSQRNKLSQEDTSITCITSHGTHCYQLFCDYVEVPYHLISIKVLNTETCTGSKDSMIRALQWCQEQDVDVINLSIGIRQYSDFQGIAEAISNLSETIIVASCSNENTITFPACLPNVIGVRHCNIESLKGRFAYIDNPYDQVDIMSYSENHSNSMVAPTITARVCNYLDEGYLSSDNIRRKLKRDSVNDTSFLNYKFYRKLLSGWESIQVPVVVFPTNLKTRVLKTLLLEFVEEGYRAVALSTNLTTNIEDYILSLRWEREEIPLTKLVELFYNFTLPDIIFMHLDIQELHNLYGEAKADITMESSWLSLDAKSILVKLKKMLE